MSGFSIRNPYFIIVVCLVIAVVGTVSLVRLPVDMFPPINIPVAVVATFYNGMPPEQIESDITGRYERFFTLASNIDHIESRSLPGVSLIKVYFQPGTDGDAAVSQISNLATANLRRLPPGTLPPVVLKFDASSLPVCLVTVAGEGMNEAALRDNAQYAVRNQIANVPGSSVPQPFGGTYRQIMIYVDPHKLEAHQLSPMDVVRAVNDSNLILPAGDVRIGPLDYSIYTNSQLDTTRDINLLPIKTEGNGYVTVADVGVAKDAQQIQQNIVRVDGQKAVYLAILKQGGDTNTLSVVDGVKEVVAHLTDVPKTLSAHAVFDQAQFVRAAIETLLHEGGIGLLLTSLMVLLFLGSFRATVAVCLSIPLAALATFLILWVGGGTVNTMVLGGLALAFSRIIDNSVVVLENIYRHLEHRMNPHKAAELGGKEVALPVLAATLTTVVVFFPVTFLYGVSRFLFTALAGAVIISLFASYFVALTVVPLYSSRFLTGHQAGGPFHKWFNRAFDWMLRRYDHLVNQALRAPGTVLAVGLLLCAATAALYPYIGLAFFPRTDAGMFTINMKAPSGTRIELTNAKVAEVEKLIRDIVPPDELQMIVANIGTTPGFSAIYSQNSAQHTAFVQVALKPEHRVGSYDYMQRISTRIAREMPELTAYFQSGGLVDAVLNLGLPAPVDIQVSGQNIKAAYTIAAQIGDQLRREPGVQDIYTPQDLDYPALKVNIDRTQAAQLGLAQKEIVSNVITALTSNQMIAPSYWVDPKSGNDYMLTVQYPENTVQTLTDFRNIPLRAAGRSQPTQLDAVTDVTRIQAPTEVDHYQLRRVIDVYVQPRTEDLGHVTSAVNRIVAGMKLPEGVRVDVRGMVQGMFASFKSFGYGLLLSVLLLYLILVAQFRSFLDPALILLAVPPGLAGVMIILAATGTTLNVQSLLGVIMMAGIVVSNSILIVDFAHRLREEGKPVREAVANACRIRLRPVLMTSMATLFGLLPMALKLGTGSEAYAPLAMAIIGGLSVSLVATVFIVPAAYLLLYRRTDHMPPAPQTEQEA
jgi:hydrophobic/amphiphilic exporter-1 (mainly G- bacteria), HAE1 family